MKFLFVEDNAVNRRVVGEMLKAGGIEMEEAEDGCLGLTKIEENNFDLVLMDLRMPRMDGLTAIRRIRARRDAKADLPIIVITADNTANMRADCVAAGANDIIEKPISMPVLFDAISRIIASGYGGEATLV